MRTIKRRFRSLALAARKRLAGTPAIRKLYISAVRIKLDVLEDLRIGRLRLPSRHQAPSGNSAGVVVSLTSYPARIDSAWIPIELMLRQDRVPDRVVLVLSDEEFPTRQIPKKLLEQQKRGLEILWVPETLRCHQKLIPTRIAYPEATIITIDDDCFYEEWLVGRLVASTEEHPGEIIGFRGWEVRWHESGLAPYVRWKRAGSATPSESVFLTGVGGIAYPPTVLPVDLVADIALMRALCPTNDDIWFWAIAHVAESPARCLGMTSYHQLRRQRDTPKLQLENRDGGMNDRQLASAIEHFGIESTLEHFGIESTSP